MITNIILIKGAHFMANSKLNPQQKDRIFELRETDGFSQKKLAALYDVSQSTIHSILKEKSAEKENCILKNTIAEAAARGYQAAAEKRLESQSNDSFDFIDRIDSNNGYFNS